MGQLVDGRWEDSWYDTKDSGGRFVRSRQPVISLAHRRTDVIGLLTSKILYAIGIVRQRFRTAADLIAYAL